MTDKLMGLLEQDKVAVDSSALARLAQYNSPYELKNRLNEIWINVNM